VYFREKALNAQAYGEETGKIITFFTTEYGLVPQANLVLVETEDGAVNGYAAPGIVFLAPAAITKQVNYRVLANQLSRQWWGILTSPRSRNQLWLENGPARFSELLYTEQAAGAGARETDLKNTYVEALTVKDPPVLQAGRLEDYSPEYWALTAAKGAAILNMLRNLVGDANFKKGLKAFLEKYSWQPATSDDFRKIMEQASNQELRYFFIQWLESSGSPEFKLEYTVLRTQNGFRVVGKINQDLDTFRMPVDLRIETEGNPEDKRIEVTGTSSEFSVDTDARPEPCIAALRYGHANRGGDTARRAVCRDQRLLGGAAGIPESARGEQEQLARALSNRGVVFQAEQLPGRRERIPRIDQRGIGSEVDGSVVARESWKDFRRDRAAGPRGERV
jgi:hypothetical protein